MDLSGAPGCRNPFEEPRSNVDSVCKTRIWFSRSTNGGLRWTKPRMINDPATLNDQFNPWMVVDETTGALGIIYYDTAGESRTRVNLWYQSSFDEGVTWRAPVRVSSAASEAIGTSGGNFQYGDYNGFSGIAGTFFPSWTDRRVIGAQQVWTAPIRDSKSGVCKTTDLFTDSVGKGVASLAVPAGATETRLSFWHRRRFAGGEGGGTLKLSVDGGAPVTVPASAILSGVGIGDDALFKGIDRQPVNTVVDLDAVCDLATGSAGGCAGRSLRLVFSAGDDVSREDVWFLDEVAVTACRP
ncbi:MAG TPA: sialidase family protein [Thermoanaerobaculia bacterium]